MNYQRIRLYIRLREPLLSVVRAYIRHGLDLCRPLTVIRVRWQIASPKGNFTYQGRALPTELHRLYRSISDTTRISRNLIVPQSLDQGRDGLVVDGGRCDRTMS